MKRGVLLTVILALACLPLVVSGFQGPSAAAITATKIEKVKDNLYVITGSGVADQNAFSGGNTAGFVTDSGGKGGRKWGGWPGCPPIVRGWESSAGGGLGGFTRSDEGGLEEVVEFLRSVASCLRSCSMVSCACWSWSSSSWHCCWSCSRRIRRRSPWPCSLPRCRPWWPGRSRTPPGSRRRSCSWTRCSTHGSSPAPRTGSTR